VILRAARHRRAAGGSRTADLPRRQVFRFRNAPRRIRNTCGSMPQAVIGRREAGACAACCRTGSSVRDPDLVVATWWPNQPS
jgi:hypothetical protein